MDMSQSTGQEFQQEISHVLELATFRKMGPPTSFLDHLQQTNFGLSLETRLATRLLGDPSSGFEKSDFTYLLVGGPATAGKSKFISQLFYWLSHNPSLDESVDRIYICLATMAHYSRILKEGHVATDHGHGQYADSEYSNISNDAYELMDQVKSETQLQQPKTKLIALEFVPSAYYNNQRELKGSDRLFSAAWKISHESPENCLVVFLNQSNSISEDDTSFRAEMMSASTPEEIVEALKTYKRGIIKRGVPLYWDKMTPKDAQEVATHYKLTSTTPEGVMRNRQRIAQVKKELGLKYASYDQFYRYMGVNQLGLPEGNVIVIDNLIKVPQVLPFDLDLMSYDPAYQALRKHVDQIKGDPVFKRDGVVIR